MKEVVGDKTNTIIFPLPLDLIEPLMDLEKRLSEISRRAIRLWSAAESLLAEVGLE